MFIYDATSTSYEQKNQGKTYALMNKTLLKLARGLWRILPYWQVWAFLPWRGTTALAEIIAEPPWYSFFSLRRPCLTARGAVGTCSGCRAVFTFLAQLFKGTSGIQDRCKSKGRHAGKFIFSKVLELDGGGIERLVLFPLSQLLWMQ